MRTPSLASILFVAACLTGACTSHHHKTANTLPPGPDFSQGKRAAATPTPTSDGTRAIPPEDQVLFGFNSADLDAHDKQVLDEVAKWVKDNRDRTILVQGHADKTGAANYNMDLSARRAEAVSAYLQQQGVPDDQVMISAVGENGTQVRPKDQNRRVIIFATSVEATE